MSARQLLQRLALCATTAATWVRCDDPSSPDGMQVEPPTEIDSEADAERNSGGTQLGDEGAVPVLGRCDEDRTELEGDETAYGLSVAELVERFESTRGVPFYWRDYDWWDGSFSPVVPSHETTLDIAVTRVGGAVTEIRYRSFESSESIGGCDGVGYQIPVTAALTTADGMLAESVQTVLGVSSSRDASLGFSLALDQLQGDLELVSDEYVLEGGSLRVTARLFEGGSFGRIEPMLHVRHIGGVPPTGGSAVPPVAGSSAASTADAGSAPATGYTSERENPNELFEPRRYIATWPAPYTCLGGLPPLRPDTSAIGSSPVDLLRITQGLTRVHQTTGAPVVLSFEPLPQALCAYVGSGVLSFAGFARLSLPSMGLNARVPLTVRAGIDLRGELSWMAIERVEQGIALTASEVSSELGMVLESADQFDRLYLFVQERLELEAGTWTGRGAIRVHGYSDDAACPGGGLQSDDDAGAATGTPACGAPDFTLDAEGWLVPPGTSLLKLDWSID